MKAKQYINMMGMAAAVLLSSCVKDTLYDTPHPDYGKIAVTADWSARGEGIDIPATWRSPWATIRVRRLPPPMPPTICLLRAATPLRCGTRLKESR